MEASDYGEAFFSLSHGHPAIIFSAIRSRGISQLTMNDREREKTEKKNMVVWWRLIFVDLFHLFSIPFTAHPLFCVLFVGKRQRKKHGTAAIVRLCWKGVAGFSAS